MTIRVVTTYAQDELARRDESVTDEDRDSTGLSDFAAFQELPRDLRADVLDSLVFSLWDRDPVRIGRVLA